MWGILEDEVNKRAEHCRLGVGSTTKRSAEIYSWEGDEERQSQVLTSERTKISRRSCSRSVPGGSGLIASWSLAEGLMGAESFSQLPNLKGCGDHREKTNEERDPGKKIIASRTLSY